MSLRRLRGLCALALAALAVAAPEIAAACSVCGAGRDDKSQFAFLIGSIFLSVLPLALIGTAVYVLVRRARRIAAEEAAGIHRLPERPVRPTTRTATAASAATSPVARLRLGRPAGS